MKGNPILFSGFGFPYDSAMLSFRSNEKSLQTGGIDVSVHVHNTSLLLQRYYTARNTVLLQYKYVTTIVILLSMLLLILVLPIFS